MLVFIDESGDAGFRVAKGSTPVFVAAMVIFANGEAARSTETAVRAVMREQRVSPEFKFNKSSGRIRDAFFERVRNCPFTVRAVVVDKAAIWSPHLRSDREDFYRYFLRQMMTHDGGALVNARVILDGSGDREFRNMLRSTLRQQLGDRLADFRLSDSKSDPLLQVADMCVGAIARSYRRDRDDADRWRVMLRARIGDIWDFR